MKMKEKENDLTNFTDRSDNSKSKGSHSFGKNTVFGPIAYSNKLKVELEKIEKLKSLNKEKLNRISFKLKNKVVNQIGTYEDYRLKKEEFLKTKKKFKSSKNTYECSLKFYENEIENKRYLDDQNYDLDISLFKDLVPEYGNKGLRDSNLNLKKRIDKFQELIDEKSELIEAQDNNDQLYTFKPMISNRTKLLASTRTNSLTIIERLYKDKNSERRKRYMSQE